MASFSASNRGFSFSFLLLLSLTAAVLAAEKVPVSIFFESLCPDSQRFIVTQFSTAYNQKDLKDFIKPDFVPYGHSNGTWCQHGPMECEGNKLLGCAIHKLNNTDVLVKFINCTMALNVDRNGTAFPIEKCKAEAGAAYDEIVKCHSADEGLTFNTEYGQRTNATFGDKKFGVPYVIFNNTNDENLSNNLTSNFLSTLCNVLKNDKVGACKNSASTLVGTLIPAILAFIIARIY